MGNDWTEEEKELLRSWPKDRTLIELAELLGRSYGGVRIQHYRLIGPRNGRKKKTNKKERQLKNRFLTEEERIRFRNFVYLILKVQQMKEKGNLIIDDDWFGLFFQSTGSFLRRRRKQGDYNILDEKLPGIDYDM